LSERAKPAREAGESLEQVLDRAALGDRGALAELYDRFAGDVDRLCRRMLGTDEAAADARSEVFLRVQQAFASYERSRPFRPWLLAIAGHYCVDCLRRQRTEGRLFDPKELGEEDLPERGPNPLGAALLREREEALRAALAALPARYRAPLVLRYFAELSYEDIARVLDVKPGQAGVLLHRAKLRLRAALAGEAR
jgi:RNA polymerase sigma-70 factor (ECF subfamily)